MPKPASSAALAMTTPISLTQADARSDAVCAACGGGRLTEIAMDLTDGSRAEFVSCHTCEHKTWRTSGRVVPLRAVLNKAQKQR